MMPPTVPMPDDAENDDRSETPPASSTSEAGEVSTVDDKGPKTCASDKAAASADGEPDCDG